MVTLAREFDACGEVRLEIGGPKKYRVLSAEEILSVIEALDPGEHVTDEKFTADDLDNCWPHSKEYLLQILNGEYSIRSAREDLLSLVGSKWDKRAGLLRRKDMEKGNELYKKAELPAGMDVEPCPVCGADAELWQYSNDFKNGPIDKLMMCSNCERCKKYDPDSADNTTCDFSNRKCGEAFEWLRGEAVREGAPPHAGVALDEWHRLAMLEKMGQAQHGR